MANCLHHDGSFRDICVCCANVLGRKMRVRAETIAIYIITGLFVFSLTTLAFSWFRAYMHPAIEYGSYNEIIPPVTKSPSTIRMCRDFHFSRAVDLQISRYLVRQDGNVIRSIDIGSTIVHREPGEVEQCRLLTIPEDVEPGEWLFRTYVTWSDWPFWRQTHTAPDIPLTIEE